MLIEKILLRREHLLLIALLESLHTALWTGIGTPLSQAALLIHLGLFLIWQPVQTSRQNITWFNAVIFIFLALAFTYWINWWLAIGWLILLIGIVGGRVLTNQSERYVYFLVMLFLFSELFIGCIPNLFDLALQPVILSFTKSFLALLPVLLVFFPELKKQDTAISVDLLHAITASLLTSLLALGALVIMYRSNFNYFTALFQALLVIGLGLMLISWLLSANSGHGGLSQVWTRSLLNIGTPFEQWLADLSDLKNSHTSASDFLDAAIIKLVSLPWISGVKWQINNTVNIHGLKTSHKINLNINKHPITIYTRVNISGALLLHCNLLIQLIEYLYESKVNEHELEKQAHLQAIYETGARITHDIKNLLQSMHSMVVILQADNAEGDSKSLVIMKKQFPYFIQRLEQAMHKLQTPAQQEHDQIYISDWSRDLISRYRDLDIKFSNSFNENPLIPFEMLDSVSENLLENAITKRRSEPSIEIRLNISVDTGDISLTVSDTGTAIVDKIVAILFREPIKSDNGLGIGLLQAAKQATAYGYKLQLVTNEDGNVTFELRNHQNLSG